MKNLTAIILVLTMVALASPIALAKTADMEVYVPTNNAINTQGVLTAADATLERKKIGIKEACKVLREIMLPLEKGIRADILKNLPLGQLKTFSTLKKEMGVPSTTLHSNLKALENLGYVRKTDEWPARYAATPDVEYVRSIATDLKAREMERLRSRFEDTPTEAES